MPDFLFDLPLLISGPVIVVALCVFGLVGLEFVRRRILPRLDVRLEDSEFSGAMLQSVMVFYGLAVALIAVNVSQTYNDTSRIVSGEAIAINAIGNSATEGIGRIECHHRAPLTQLGSVIARSLGEMPRAMLSSSGRR